ncbi:MAG TPA: ATP-dependent DNA helicase UvrD2 [Egibacteraceae bacterium]|nr:ATP-dependent DNA helicase UvrD2 [Egibacteraceae bacterium]
MSGALLDGLNPAQRQAAEAVRGPVCILAGAGSGKTRTITHRIAHQVASGVARPDQILAVTFTDRAATELRERLRRLGMPGTVRAATFHAAAWAQLRYFWPRFADAPLPEVLPHKVRLLVPTARRLRVEARDLAAEIEWAKARRLGPEAYAARADGRDGPLPTETMAEVYASYESAKAQRNLVDYDDMLLLTTRLLEEQADVAAEVRERYPFLTVDEFQDVNPAQWALLRAWLGDADELCVVGDDDQTIYHFTGASSAYLTGFRRHFPHARVITLTESYRSTPQVLALANSLLSRKRAGRRAPLVTRLAPGPAPAFKEFADAGEEVDCVTRAVRHLLEEGTAPGEVAICYRVNSQSEAFEAALGDAGIPYVVRGEAGFFERAEVRQALRVLAAEIGRPAPAGPPAVAESEPAQAARADRAVERVLRERLSFHPRKPPEGEAARERWRNLGALLDIAALAVQARADVSYDEVVTDLLTRAARGQEAPTPDGAVTLLTLHKAKGLEFDAVFLVALEEGLMPISHAREDAEIAEEHRLLYVGVTRARRHLWLSWARSRPGYAGKPMTRRPSRFLYDLGDGAPRRVRTPTEHRRRPVDDGLVSSLREWRRQRAHRDGQPAFVVFNDRTLEALASRRPASTDELLGVHGLGPAKVRRYGDELLRLLRDGS